MVLISGHQNDGRPCRCPSCSNSNGGRTNNKYANFVNYTTLGAGVISDDDIYSNLKIIFSETFSRDDIPLSAKLTAADVKGWDSFKQIEIVIATESCFGIKFTTAELDNLKNVGDLARIIAERGRLPRR